MGRSIRLSNNDFLCGDYASFNLNNSATLNNLVAWAYNQIPFNNNVTFSTNNSNSFESNGNYIKCKFKGKVLVIREFSTDYRGETDIIDEFGWFTATDTKQAYSYSIANVNVGDNINFIFSGGMSGTMQIFSARLIIVRIA